VLGVGLLDAWIERHMTGRGQFTNGQALTWYGSTKHWWARPEVMFEEILGEPDV
jgi:hypothetical protein